MDRRGVIDKAISTLQLKEELDWDRLLWMPGEKKFFLPSIELFPRLYLNWDFDKNIQALIQEARRRPQETVGRWEGMCDECYNENPVREWMGINRSETPMWRATNLRPANPRSLRVPLDIPASRRFVADDRKEIVRPSFYTAFDWAKK